MSKVKVLRRHVKSLNIFSRGELRYWLTDELHIICSQKNVCTQVYYVSQKGRVILLYDIIYFTFNFLIVLISVLST